MEWAVWLGRADCGGTPIALGQDIDEDRFRRSNDFQQPIA